MTPTARAPREVSFDALPDEVVVAIFERVQGEGEREEKDSPSVSLTENVESSSSRSENPRWVRETVPCVCRAWRDLYLSPTASSLRRTLEVDFCDDVGASRLRGAFVRGDRVVAWAERHRRDVRALRLFSSFSPRGSDLRPRDFSPRHLEALLVLLAPESLVEVDVGEGLSSLLSSSFWRAMRTVARSGRLRALRVRDVAVPLSSVGDVAFLSELSRLEELTLRARADDVIDADDSDDGCDFGFGLDDFPAAVPSLTNLRRVDLSLNKGITRLPRSISTLRQLESLKLSGCCFRSLPAELGALSRLTLLDVGMNANLGRPRAATTTATARSGADAVAFPDALRELRSLRHLSLRHCGLSSVPAFVEDLKALEHLDLRGNAELSEDGALTPLSSSRSLKHLDLSGCTLRSLPSAVLSSTPNLRFLGLAHNRLTSLPEDTGRRLPELRDIDLSGNCLPEVPRSALYGSAALERISVAYTVALQVHEPLDFLLEDFPRLREVRAHKLGHVGAWTPVSRAYLEAFSAKLKARDPAAAVPF